MTGKQLRHDLLRSLERSFGPTLALLVLLAFAAQSASAQNNLFIGKYEQIDPSPRIIGSFVAGSTQPIVTTPATGTQVNDGFTLPSKQFVLQSGPIASTFPGYVFVRTTYRHNGAGAFSDGFHPKSGVDLLNAPDSVYPYATLSPPVGFIRRKFGPNGFGGPMNVVGSAMFAGTKVGVGGVGFSDFGALLTATWGAVPFLPGSNRDIAGWSTAVHQSLTTMTPGDPGNPVSNNKVLEIHGAELMTGTATMSNPLPYAVTYKIATAMDERNGAGEGTIQMIAPGLSYNYAVVGPAPPPLDGSRAVTSLLTGTTLLVRTTITLPEPGQFALISSGIFGLFGLARLRRRS